MIAAQQSQADFSIENTFVAEKLRDVADQLEQQANAHFRVRAYREAASYVAALSYPIRDIYEKKGRRGLEDLPKIGVSISAAIAVLLDSGAWEVLGRYGGAHGHCV
ncbi:helix-hairpin-helix domain-containing protein [Sulfitobacter sp.]|uniref:helix-hairpin-helix domain-containing protein n=1 Tax=Sulfitobacter sp. TaxID=1903071 RepID=UPI003002D397